MFSTLGVVVPRRLQVLQDHVTPVVQYKDSQVIMATKSYKHSEVKESVKHSSTVTMDTADTSTNDDVSYDGQSCVLTREVFQF